MPKDYVITEELTSYIESYLNTLSEKSRSDETLRRYKVYFSVLQSWLGVRPFTQSTYKEYIAYLQEDYSVSTVLSVCSQLNNLIKYLWKNGVLDSNFSISLETLPQVEKTIEEPLGVTAAEMIYMAASEYHRELGTSVSLRAFAICELLYCFGIRVDELIALCVNSVKEDVIEVGKSGAIRKLKRDRELPAVDLLSSPERDADDYLLSVKAYTPVSPATIKASVRRVTSFINYSEDFNPSMFRQAKAMELVRKGWKYYEIAAYLGCSDTRAKVFIERYGGHSYD